MHFKQAYDSVMKKNGIIFSLKLIILTKMCSEWSKRDALSPLFSNFALESAIRTVQENRGRGTVTEWDTSHSALC